MVSYIFTSDNWFLIAAAFVWIIAAVVQDFRRREIANWWNFSFIVVAIAYRIFLSVAKSNYWYALWGFIGLAVGFGIANAFYYARIFAGGDAKLLIGLGAVLPFGMSLAVNLKILAWFFLLFLLAGGAYGIVYSIFLVLMNRRRFASEFSAQLIRYKIAVFSVAAASVVMAVLNSVFKVWLGVWLSVLLFAAPWLLLYAKAIEESCMIKKVRIQDLTVGDWLVAAVVVGRKKIQPNWQGLSCDELKILKKKKGRVLIRYGIPYTPAFLLAFAGLLVVFWLGLEAGFLWMV